MTRSIHNFLACSYLQHQGTNVVRCLVLLVVAAVSIRQAEAATTTLEFETDTLDCDTGIVLEIDPAGADETEGADLRISYNADRQPHAVIVPGGEGVEFAYLDGVAFETIDAGLAAGLTFSSEPLDVSFDSSDTIVIKTDTGALFKLGRAVENDTSVTLDYEPLHEEGQP